MAFPSFMGIYHGMPFATSVSWHMAHYDLVHNMATIEPWHPQTNLSLDTCCHELVHLDMNTSDSTSWHSTKLILLSHCVSHGHGICNVFNLITWHPRPWQ